MNTQRRASVLLLSLALACAGSPLTVEELPISADPTREIESLDSALQEARAQNVDVLSPTWFARASASLATARSLRRQGAAVDETLRHVANGRAELRKAQDYASIGRTALADVIESRQAARVAGATDLGDEYQEAENAFLELTRGIEEDRLQRAQQRRDAVSQAYRALELKAIKEKTLAAVKAKIGEARAQGAAQLAPRALQAASDRLSQAEKFIAQDRYATEQMNERAQEALFYANRALAITQFAAESKRRTPEQQAEDAEAFLAVLTEELGHSDLRDRPIGEQRRTVQAKLAELRKDRDFLVSRSELLRNENDRLAGQLASLQGTAESLRSEQEFNRIYAEAQSSFDPNEAEVYKQGNKLLIRLRGVNFQVGEAMLQPEDYRTLTKVQNAIRAFGDPIVTVEGHTDSTGSEAVNQHLSEQRANAVREYMIANNVLPSENIHAVGRGPSAPLAPNTSAEGRALNRRIDVIIDPQRLPAVATGGSE